LCYCLHISVFFRCFPIQFCARAVYNRLTDFSLRTRGNQQVWLRSLARERPSWGCFDQLRRGSAAVCLCQAVGGPYVARYKRFESSDP
jgi:hypothetical protein